MTNWSDHIPPIFDELEELRLMYDKEQLLKLWEDCRPKLSDPSYMVFVLGTKGQ
jgi:hypothetical protein